MDLALQHSSLRERGFLKEAQLLHRFAFETPSPEHRVLRSGLQLDVPAAKALWEKLNLSELCCLCAEPLQQVSEDFDFRLLKEDRFDEPRDESAWRQKIIFERRPMQDDDWQKLAAVAHEVGVLQHQTRPALRSGTLDSDHDYDPLQYVRDWCRFVGAVQTPQRQVWDVEESLEWLATLCNDDSEYCMVLVVLEALGHLLANLLNQPTQSQVVMEEDAYCIAANLGLEDAKRQLFAMEENTSEDFSEVRQKVLDVLRAVSLALSNGHHDGNLHLVRVVAGLLAVDWSLKRDTVQLTDDVGVRSVFAACRCEKLLPEPEESRFSCWRVAWDETELKPCEHRLLYLVALPRECLLQFDFPMTERDALKLSGLRGIVSPVKPARWQRLCERALEKGAVEQGVPGNDFNKELFDWDYRIYLAANGRRLVPLMLEKRRCPELPCLHEGCRRPACFSPPKEASARFCRGHRTHGMVEFLEALERTWCLVGVEFEVQPLFEAKACLPPSDETCKAGPDARLPRVLALLNEAPERLQLNLLAHRKQKLGEGVHLMETGVPFLVGNTAAPRSSDKRAASTILRMAVFGAKYGVRSRMDQPLGGEEISAACIGSARNSVMSSLENECRRARQGGNNQKEVTALWNKRATIKAGLALQKPCGRIYGPPIYDGRCRHLRAESKYPCMALLSKKLECRSCKKVYAEGNGAGKGMRELVRRKRLLEDPGSLLVSKKMRLKRFAPANHAILHGTRCLNIMEAVAVEEGERGDITVLPSDCRLSRDRESAAVYPAAVVYYLGREGRLQASRAEQRRPAGGSVSDLDAAAGRSGVNCKRSSCTFVRQKVAFFFVRVLYFFFVRVFAFFFVRVFAVFFSTAGVTGGIVAPL